MNNNVYYDFNSPEANTYCMKPINNWIHQYININLQYILRF